MKILGLGVPELIIILVVVLLIFGPKNLPKLGNALGRTVKSLREGMGAGKKVKEEEAEEIVEEEIVEEPKAQATLTAAEETPSTPKKRKVRKVKTTPVDSDSETVTA